MQRNIRILTIVLFALCAGCADENSVTQQSETNPPVIESTNLTTDLTPEVIPADDDADTATKVQTPAPRPVQPVEQPKPVTPEEAVLKWIDRVHGSVSREYQNNKSWVRQVDLKDVHLGPKEMRRLLLFPKLEYISFSKVVFFPGALDQLAALEHLNSLNIMNSRLRTGDLIALSEIESLEHLRILYHGLSDTSLSVLAELDQIEHAALYDIGITPENMYRLRGMKNLKTLNLYRNDLPQLDWDTLSSLNSLTALWLSECKLTDESLIGIDRCRGLETLDLSDNKIHDSALSEIAKLDHLHTLYIRRNRLNGSGFSRLTDDTLTKIWGGDNPYTLEGVPSMRQNIHRLMSFSPKPRTDLSFDDYVEHFGEFFTGVEAHHDPDRPKNDTYGTEIQVSFNKGRPLYFYEFMTGEMFRSLSKCVKLIYLECDGIPFDDSYATADLTQLQNLQYVTITNSRKPISDKGFQMITGCNKVERIEIENVSFSSAATESLTGFDDLRTLTINGGQFEGDVFTPVSRLATLTWIDATDIDFLDGLQGVDSLKKVTHLNLNGSKLIENDYRAITKLPNVKFLSLDETDVTDKDLVQLGTMPQLQHLNLRDTKISPIGLVGIGNSNSMLRYVSHRGSNVTDDDAQALADRFEWTFEGECSCGCLDFEPQGR